MMQHDPVGRFDPASDPGRWEAMVATILARAEHELERRRRRVSLARALVGWSRPALSAAAAIVLLSVTYAVLGRGVDPVELGEEQTAGLASALVPEQVAAWLVTDYRPTVTELVVALGGVPR